MWFRRYLTESVFVMRTGEIGLIFIISIIQSIISMTNSVLNNDSTQMQDDKWKKYKQRLPPTFGFIKHAISLLSEVVYRIGLLALFWTVCGGWPFGIMLVYQPRIIVYNTMKLIDAMKAFYNDQIHLFTDTNNVIIMDDGMMDDF